MKSSWVDQLMEMRNFIVQREIVVNSWKGALKNRNQMGNIREYIATRNVIGKKTYVRAAYHILNRQSIGQWILPSSNITMTS